MWIIIHLFNYATGEQGYLSRDAQGEWCTLTIKMHAYQLSTYASAAHIACNFIKRDYQNIWPDNSSEDIWYRLEQL